MKLMLLASLTCFNESFDNQGLEWIFKNTADLGLDGLEFWNVRGEMENPAEIERLMKEYNVASPSYCCVGTNFAASTSEERLNARDVIRENLEICHRIKAGIMRIDLGHTDSPDYFDVKSMLVDAIVPCVEDAKKANVVLAIHNHGTGWTGESLVIKDIIDTIDSPYLRSRLCPGNFLLVEKETDPVVSTVELIPLTGGMFLKDWCEQEDAGEKGLSYYEARGKKYIGTSIGKGVIDYTRFFELLNKADFSGIAVLNIEKGFEGDILAIRESVDFVRKTIRRFAT